MVTGVPTAQLSGRPTLVGVAVMTLDKGMSSNATVASRAVPDELSELLIAVAEHKDRKAFIKLFEHFGPRVKSYLKRLGVNDSEADDLMQEVMLTVWRRAEQFDCRKARASTWIFTITRNKRIDAIRRERRPELDPNDPALVPDRDEDPSEAVSANEWRAAIKRAIDEVPEEQAKLLRMSFFEDKTHDAIATELDLPLGTVKSRIRLAVAKLRRSLEELR
ncbi:MAG: sigma-70 family RNA polymerase sigma factor [Kiloniellales bacterium]|nr:sigma-70 family RNA polymerase sigma factor [Kiloniellales bacterium]